MKVQTIAWNFIPWFYGLNLVDLRFEPRLWDFRLWDCSRCDNHCYHMLDLSI